MNVTCVELPSGRIIDLAEVVSLTPGYRKDRDYDAGIEVGERLTRTATIYLSGGHQSYLQGPDAERLIEVFTRTRVLIKSEAPKPQPKPQRPPGYKGGEAVRLHGYRRDEDGSFFCPTCTVKAYPTIDALGNAELRPVFGTVFDQDTNRCCQCGAIA